MKRDLSCLQVSLAVLHANMDQLLACSDEGEAMTILGRWVWLKWRGRVCECVVGCDWSLSPSCRYLDNVVNKQTVSPPIPHLHALLTSGNTPPPEIDVFELIKASYEVRGRGLLLLVWPMRDCVYVIVYISLWWQKFGSLRADVIEQMRFKQRLKVIQSLEDTAKRSVVCVCVFWECIFTHLPGVMICASDVQVRAIMTESAFTIEELEELYVLFKVRWNLNACVVRVCVFKC